MTSANNGVPKLQLLQFSKQIPADCRGKCQQQYVTFYHASIAYFTPSGKSVIFPWFESKTSTLKRSSTRKEQFFLTSFKNNFPPPTAKILVLKIQKNAPTAQKTSPAFYRSLIALFETLLL